MMYHAQSKKFTHDLRDLDEATLNLLYAMKHLRKLAGLPLTKYKRDGLLTDADHVQKGIIDAAKAMGIDFGVSWGENLDLTDAQG